MTKEQTLKLQNFAYHLGLAHKNLDELLKSLPVIEEKATKGKKEAPKEEMEEVESKFKETKATKGKKAKVEEIEEEEEVSNDDEFDFDDAEVEEEEVSEPEFTEADARTAMTTYAKKTSKEKALAILGKFAKTKKIADVPPAKLGALIAALKVGK
jgi:hypothetical protein